VPVKTKVRELRSAKDWSQGELAKRLDVSRQTVNAIETGRYEPSLSLAFKIARLFGKPVEGVFEP
jgi:putative transcriptional regulator